MNLYFIEISHQFFPQRLFLLSDYKFLLRKPSGSFKKHCDNPVIENDLK